MFWKKMICWVITCKFIFHANDLLNNCRLKIHTHYHKCVCLPHTSQQKPCGILQNTWHLSHHTNLLLHHWPELFAFDPTSQNPSRSRSCMQLRILHVSCHKPCTSHLNLSEMQFPAKPSRNYLIQIKTNHQFCTIHQERFELEREAKHA